MKLITDEQLDSLTDEERKFYEIIKQIPIRKQEQKRKCDVPLDLDDEECRALLSIGGTKTTEAACLILEPVYSKYRELSKSNKYRGKGVMPTLIARCLHYIIYVDCFRKVDKNKKSLINYNAFNVSKTLDLLNIKSNSFLDKMGIRPVRDYCFEMYEAIKSIFAISTAHRDELHHEILKRILFYSDYAMFVDLIGEHSILSSFYFNKREVVCSADFIVLNFYHALMLRKDEFLKKDKFLARMKTGLKNDSLKKTIEKYRKDLKNERNKMKSRVDEYNEYKKQYDKCISHKIPTLPTYPFRKGMIDVVLAYKYLFVMLDDNKCQFTQIDEIISYLELLHNRLKNACFCWIEPKDLFHVALNEKMRLPVLDKKDDGSDTDVQMEYKKDFDFFAKKKTNRNKMGMLFYDSILDSSNKNENVAAFSSFIRRSDCLWIFVCKREDEEYIKLLESKGNDNIKIIYINQKLHGIKRILHFKVDTVIITNAVTELFMDSVTTDRGSCNSIVTDKILSDFFAMRVQRDLLVLIKPHVKNQAAFDNEDYYSLTED